MATMEDTSMACIVYSGPNDQCFLTKWGCHPNSLQNIFTIQQRKLKIWQNPNTYRCLRRCHGNISHIIQILESRIYKVTKVLQVVWVRFVSVPQIFMLDGLEKPRNEVFIKNEMTFWPFPWQPLSGETKKFTCTLPYSYPIRWNTKNLNLFF